MTFLLIVCQLFSAPPFMPLSVATADDALAMFYNPAGLAVNREQNIYYLYEFKQGRFGDKSTIAGQLGPLGFSWIPESPARWGIGLGIKLGDITSFGVRYSRRYESFWSIGTMIRPSNTLSLGVTWPDIDETNWRAIITGLGIRPLGNKLTILVEAKLDSIKKPWLGLQFQPYKGIELRGMAKTNKSFSVGIDISFGQTGIGYTASKLADDLEHSAYLRLSKEIRPSVIPAKSRYMTIKLTGLIRDVKPGFSLFGPTAKRTTYELLELLNKVKDDKAIIGIILNIESLQISFAQCSEIREVLQEIKTKGKKIIVYAPFLSANTYFLASVADYIISHPLGEVNIPGMYSKVSFVKGTLGKLGIEAEFERSGKYKTAPEILTEDSLSPAYREVLNSVLDDYYQYFRQGLEEARGFTQEEIENKINHGFYSAESAKTEGLIDTFGYADQLDSILEAKFGKIRKISDKSYMKRTFHKKDWKTESSKIAIIYNTGMITRGKSGTDPLSGEVSMGAKTITKAIKKACKDKSVKAIVLRINTGGGEGFASDLIWHELEKTKTKKPIIVSMGPVAASGGYYIACNSDKIFALPTTITGSIGAFSLKMVLAGLYEKIGMKTEVLKRGEHADAESDHRKLTDDERDIMKKAVEDHYRQFVEKVAQGRNKTFDYIDSIGKGRVWTGNQAKSLGLVDSLAGFLTAIEYAKEKAKVKQAEMVFLPKPRSFFFGSMLNWVWARFNSRYE
jgi:protease-4